MPIRQLTLALMLSACGASMRPATAEDIEYIEQLEAELEVAAGIARRTRECTPRLASRDEARRASDEICDFVRELQDDESRARCDASREQMVSLDMTVNGACGAGLVRN